MLLLMLCSSIYKFMYNNKLILLMISFTDLVIKTLIQWFMNVLTKQDWESLWPRGILRCSLPYHEIAVPQK